MTRLDLQVLSRLISLEDVRSLNSQFLGLAVADFVDNVGYSAPLDGVLK